MCCVQLQTSFQAQAQCRIVVPRALCDSCSKNQELEPRNLSTPDLRPLWLVCAYDFASQALGQKIIDRPLSSDFVSLKAPHLAKALPSDDPLLGLRASEGRCRRWVHLQRDAAYARHPHRREC